jgi:hypothetical protein
MDKYEEAINAMETQKECAVADGMDSFYIDGYSLAIETLKEHQDALKKFDELWPKLNAYKEAYYKTPVGKLRLLKRKLLGK